MTMTKKYTITENNIDSKIQDELVMVNVSLGKYFSLNEVASIIWELLKKSVSIEEIVADLLTQFDIDRETCEKEVSSFVNELISLKLVKEV